MKSWRYKFQLAVADALENLADRLRPETDWHHMDSRQFQGYKILTDGHEYRIVLQGELKKNVEQQRPEGESRSWHQESLKVTLRPEDLKIWAGKDAAQGLTGTVVQRACAEMLSRQRATVPHPNMHVVVPFPEQDPQV